MNVKKAHLGSIRRKRRQQQDELTNVIRKMETEMSVVFKRTHFLAKPFNYHFLDRYDY